MSKGQRLKELRESKRLSQTEAARHIGVSKQTLYKYENDIITNIPSDVIERIATLYETTPAYIMGWDIESLQIAADRLKEIYVSSGMADLQERLSKYDLSQVIKALDFLDAFQTASADARAMIEGLLKSHQSDS